MTGIHLAGLLFYLNPALPFTAGAVLRGALLYGALLGLAGLLLQLPFTWGRPGRARRALPWGLTVALAVAAVLDGAHVSYYAYFLPPGINDRLLKTALWLALAALIGFYTALLHTLHRRRYGARSRLAFLLLPALSVLAMVERREAFRPAAAPAPRPAAFEAGRSAAVWVIGIDSATLDAILPLAGQGRLPFLGTVLHSGAYGRLETISPTRRDAVWTTLATGKFPYKHGVIGRRAYPAGFLAPGGRLELLPAGISFRRWGTLGGEPLPPSPTARRALALWEILPRLGAPSGVVGWPLAAPGRGVAELTLAGPGRVSQPGRREIAAEVGSHFGRRPPAWLLEALRGDLRRQTLTLSLAGQEAQAQALFLVLPGLREVSRRSFGGFSAVQFEGQHGARAASAAANRLAAYYVQLDAFLAEVWARGKGPRLLVIVSAYGVDPQGGWRRLWGQMAPGRALGGEFLGAPDGVLLLYGEGIRPGALLTGARLVDLVPTLLYGLGFPVARDLDGQVLTAAFAKEFLAGNPVTFLPSYEGLKGSAASAVR